MLNAGQQKALQAVQDGRNIFITGGGGVGKSFVLDEITRWAKAANQNVLITASTGIAARNVGGVTVHKAFLVPVPLSKLEPDRVSDAVLLADLIIIDEVSMCRADIFEFVSKSIDMAESSIKQYQEMEKTGTLDELGKEKDMAIEALKHPHKQLVVSGDFCQLPPVVTDTDEHILEAFFGRKMGRAFPFQSLAWDGFDFVTISLTEVIRQKETDYINALNLARLGDQNCLTWFNEHAAKAKRKYAISIVPTNKEADRLNRKELDSIQSKSFTYVAKIEGKVNAKDIPALDELTLKVGAHVVLLVNGVFDNGDGQIEYYNGSLGTVTKIENENVTISLREGGNIEVTRHLWEQKDAIIKTVKKNGKSKKVIEYETVGTFSQIPLKLAYAVSIHKSQGQTYDAANIYPAKIWDAGQLYTALSRCRDVSEMWLASKLKPALLIVDTAVQLFYQGKWHNPKQRGGKRPGAGRKARHGKTTTLRVPACDIDLIKAFIAGLHSDQGSGAAYEAGRALASKK